MDMGIGEDLMDDPDVTQFFRSVFSDAPEDAITVDATNPVLRIGDTDDLGFDSLETSPMNMHGPPSTYYDIDTGCLPQQLEYSEGSQGAEEQLTTGPPSSTTVMEASSSCEFLNLLPLDSTAGTSEPEDFSRNLTTPSQPGFPFPPLPIDGLTSFEPCYIGLEDLNSGTIAGQDSQPASWSLANPNQLQYGTGQQQTIYHHATSPLLLHDLPPNPQFQIADNTQPSSLTSHGQRWPHDPLHFNSVAEYPQNVLPMTQQPVGLDSQQMFPDPFSSIHLDRMPYNPLEIITGGTFPATYVSTDNERDSGSAGVVVPASNQLSGLQTFSAPFHANSQLLIQRPADSTTIFYGPERPSEASSTNRSKHPYRSAKSAQKTSRKTSKKGASSRALDKHKAVHSSQMQKKTGVSTDMFPILTFGACVPFAAPKRARGKKKQRNCWFCYLKHKECSGDRDGDPPGCRSCKEFWHKHALASTSWRWACDSRASLYELFQGALNLDISNTLNWFDLRSPQALEISNTVIYVLEFLELWPTLHLFQDSYMAWLGYGRNFPSLPTCFNLAGPRPIHIYYLCMSSSEHCALLYEFQEQCE
ncbi:hypothetical protein P171DRAFT_433529 [Karstenula rhodostoma CBS 690.94]|uniref:Uncharacterized protein n=1 Tax=Karstenula rhodostoma CBS 690.94 TaxID=1392251 RepID=A0A9P4PDV3_9PLEO|nr:hypothetical protein P171DRAFT_433529 [Karstenula rhodostoma CBS 690.94]